MATELQATNLTTEKRLRRTQWLKQKKNEGILLDNAREEGCRSQVNEKGADFYSQRGGPAIKEAGPSHTRNPAAGDLFTLSSYHFR